MQEYGESEIGSYILYNTVVPNGLSRGFETVHTLVSILLPLLSMTIVHCEYLKVIEVKYRVKVVNRWYFLNTDTAVHHDSNIF